MAQNDTLLFESFEFDMSSYMTNAPTGIVDETFWVNFDLDGLSDGSGSSRPGDWFQTTGFSDADSATIVMAGSSWTSPPTTVANWLMTPSIQISDTNAVLSWKSAPFQTPRYLDGYMVLISTATNNETDFTDTIFVAGEFESQGTLTDSSYNNFTFTPPNSFIHGQDGQYVEYSGDSVRLTGVLRPFTYDLKDYSGGHIYVAFVHNSTDDNLISIDDIVITGTDATSVMELKADISLNVFPNPAMEMASVSYKLRNASPVFFDMFDMNGKLVRTEAKGLQPAGEYLSTLNVGGLAHGYYNVVVRTSEGSSVKKLMIK